MARPMIALATFVAFVALFIGIARADSASAPDSDSSDTTTGTAPGLFALCMPTPFATLISIDREDDIDAEAFEGTFEGLFLDLGRDNMTDLFPEASDLSEVAGQFARMGYSVSPDTPLEDLYASIVDRVCDDIAHTVSADLGTSAGDKTVAEVVYDDASLTGYLYNILQGNEASSAPFPSYTVRYE